MKISEALRSIQTQLSPKIGDFAVPQSEEIMEFVLKCSRSELYLKAKECISSETEKQIDLIVRERLSGVPLQYILGKVYFFNREFSITPDVLIPRPDTEILVEHVLRNEIAEKDTFVDIGTGSGIIACILSEEHSGWVGTCVDISYRSLLVAKSNALRPLNFLCSDLLTACKDKPFFNFIVSNPPYISENEMNTLDPEVKDHEPVHALCGGRDGLNFYRYLSETGKRFIFPGGSIYCEIGYNQEQSVKELFLLDGWVHLSVHNDLGNNPRVLRAVKPI